MGNISGSSRSSLELISMLHQYTMKILSFAFYIFSPSVFQSLAIYSSLNASMLNISFIYLSNELLLQSSNHPSVLNPHPSFTLSIHLFTFFQCPIHPSFHPLSNSQYLHRFSVYIYFYPFICPPPHSTIHLSHPSILIPQIHLSIHLFLSPFILPSSPHHSIHPSMHSNNLSVFTLSM